MKEKLGKPKVKSSEVWDLGPDLQIKHILLGTCIALLVFVNVKHTYMFIGQTRTFRSTKYNAAYSSFSD